MGYSVVAQFIVQSESMECISETLNVLKELKSNWNPPFFLCDFSDAEFSALKQAFPSTTVYGCDFHRDFHRKQAWTRWVQDRENALERSDADCLLELLRACAWAPPGSGDSAVDVNYQKGCLCAQGVSCVEEECENWLTSNWLNHVNPTYKGISLLG